MSDKLFSVTQSIGDIQIGNYLGAIKNWHDIDCQKMLLKNINDYLLPINERYFYITSQPEYRKKVFDYATKKDKKSDSKTIYQVKQKMGLL